MGFTQVTLGAVGGEIHQITHICSEIYSHLGKSIFIGTQVRIQVFGASGSSALCHHEGADVALY